MRVIYPRRPQTIEVIANTYMYFKVVTKDQLAPGKIQFSYAPGTYVRKMRKPDDKATRVELSVYFSTDEKNKEPNKENNEKSIESPYGTFLLPIQGKDRFDNPEVYVSFFSITGCKVIVTASFPEIYTKSLRNRQLKEDITDESEFQNFMVVKNWAKLKEKMALENNTNFIRAHVKQVGDYSLTQKERLVMSREMRDNLLERAKIKR